MRQMACIPVRINKTGGITGSGKITSGHIELKRTLTVNYAKFAMDTPPTTPRKLRADFYLLRN